MRDRAVHFVTCAPGLEPVLHEELRALRLGKVERQVGGVRFEGAMRDAWRANLELRTAIRVLRRVARFEAPDREALYAGAREIPWERWLAPDGTLRVDAGSTRSALDHTRFVEQVVKDAIVDRFQERGGTRPSVDKEEPTLRVHAHLVEDRATLSVDTSGHSLHRRGWRRHQGRAPLPETLAAAMVLLSGWDRRAPLIDPFCGSGTLLVEAGWIAAGRAPGAERRFAFEGWPGHEAARWRAERERILARKPPARMPRLIGRDRDPERIAEARANVEAAGLAEHVELEAGDALELAPRPGWNATVVSNLPFGLRVGEEEELAALYRGFGRVLRERCAGFRMALLTADPRLRKKLGLSRARRVEVVHGGLAAEISLSESI